MSLLFFLNTADGRLPTSAVFISDHGATHANGDLPTGPVRARYNVQLAQFIIRISELITIGKKAVSCSQNSLILYVSQKYTPFLSSAVEHLNSYSKAQDMERNNERRVVTV